ncbi:MULTISPECIES: hypothetical protein [Streptomyces]|uniref:Uncharacterized protein n=1 Tax=Streptomyces tsukubensis (strain DSM 42081 / NBRC 108919 / NRRL 18488 / 9993) TaxID=1114943 RepID=A0A7G3UDJ8_STRT9|nr:MULTISPECIES: hypothetical protein [Streptomyces]AZK95472.1 hypothetical protein B7R87_17605 [Streptomyces tsukubensis]MYS66631.1 hypothetical protein [Streptomyces sp. SID5473]QKM68484.1 hypothetical protein STSU_016195 [Streptomyces tsukubensis NRRL18488]TAI43296.1 hypothetical protein EWI31_15960 [Streptomyces tsukubensis]
MTACAPGPHTDRSPLWTAFSWSFIALSVAYTTALLMLLPESHDCRYAAASGDLTDTGYDAFPPDQWCVYDGTERVSSAPVWVAPVLWTTTATTALFGVWAFLEKRVPPGRPHGRPYGRPYGRPRGRRRG